MKITGHDAAKTAELASEKNAGLDPSSSKAAKNKNLAQTAPLPSSANVATSRVRETIRDAPDIRADRVAELRARIKSGSFQPDAGKVAEKMLNSHLREDLERP